MRLLSIISTILLFSGCLFAQQPLPAPVNTVFGEVMPAGWGQDLNNDGVADRSWLLFCSNRLDTQTNGALEASWGAGGGYFFWQSWDLYFAGYPDPQANNSWGAYRVAPLQVSKDNMRVGSQNINPTNTKFRLDRNFPYLVYYRCSHPALTIGEDTDRNGLADNNICIFWHLETWWRHISDPNSVIRAPFLCYSYAKNITGNFRNIAAEFTANAQVIPDEAAIFKTTQKIVPRGIPIPTDNLLLLSWYALSSKPKLWYKALKLNGSLPPLTEQPIERQLQVSKGLLYCKDPYLLITQEPPTPSGVQVVNFFYTGYCKASKNEEVFWTRYRLSTNDYENPGLIETLLPGVQKDAQRLPFLRIADNQYDLAPGYTGGDLLQPLDKSYSLYQATHPDWQPATIGNDMPNIYVNGNLKTPIDATHRWRRCWDQQSQLLIYEEKIGAAVWKAILKLDTSTGSVKFVEPLGELDYVTADYTPSTFRLSHHPLYDTKPIAAYQPPAQAISLPGLLWIIWSRLDRYNLQATTLFYIIYRWDDLLGGWVAAAASQELPIPMTTMAVETQPSAFPSAHWQQRIIPHIELFWTSSRQPEDPNLQIGNWDLYQQSIMAPFFGVE